jgi:predicted S18 family serine protease
MMPWAELHMEHDPAKMPWTLQLIKIDKATAEFFNQMWSDKRADHEKYLADKKAEGKYGEYVYAFAMAMAMFAASLAIVAIGSEDEAEKTLIPAKK